MPSIYTAELVLQFSADDIDHADELIDNLADWLEDFHDFELESAHIEETVELEEDE